MHQKLCLVFIGLFIQMISLTTLAEEFIFKVPQISGTPEICQASKIGVTNHPNAPVSSLLFGEPLIDLHGEKSIKKYYTSNCNITFYPEKYSVSLKADLFLDVRMKVIKTAKSSLIFTFSINGKQQRLEYLPTRYVDEENSDDVKLLRFKISNFEYSKKPLKINLHAEGFISPNTNSSVSEMSFLSIDSIDLCLATQNYQDSCGKSF